jgi:hypothetical protein
VRADNADGKMLVLLSILWVVHLVTLLVAFRPADPATGAPAMHNHVSQLVLKKQR